MFIYQVDLIKEVNNGLPISGPAIDIPLPILSQQYYCSVLVVYATVSVALTLNANFLQFSADNINWLQSSVIVNTVGSFRIVTTNASNSTFPRYFRFRRTDAVGTITQLIIHFDIQ